MFHLLEVADCQVMANAANNEIKAVALVKLRLSTVCKMATMLRKIESRRRFLRRRVKLQYVSIVYRFC